MVISVRLPEVNAMDRTRSVWAALAGPLRFSGPSWCGVQMTIVPSVAPVAAVAPSGAKAIVEIAELCALTGSPRRRLSP
ncbi:hypothetical protein GCM10020295_10310 [Streptomyces cinereospinus]